VASYTRRARGDWASVGGPSISVDDMPAGHAGAALKISQGRSVPGNVLVNEKVAAEDGHSAVLYLMAENIVPGVRAGRASETL